MDSKASLQRAQIAHTHTNTHTHRHTHTHTREPTQFRHALNSSILTIGLYRHTSTHTRKCAYKFSIFQGLQRLRMDDGALTANSEDKKIAWKKLSWKGLAHRTCMG